METLVAIAPMDEYASSHLQVEADQAVPSENVNSQQSAWLFRVGPPLGLACLALVAFSGWSVLPLSAHGQTPSGSASHPPHMQEVAFSPTLSLIRPSMPQARAAFARPSLRQGGKATYRPVQRPLGVTMMAPTDVAPAGKDSPAGSVQGYMSKIPPHLAGLAIRKVKREVRDYASKPMTETEKIQAEMDKEDDDELDQFDYAMSQMEDVKVTAAGRTMDFNDAQVMHGMKNSMHPDDFKKVFGKLGDLL